MRWPSFLVVIAICGLIDMAKGQKSLDLNTPGERQGDCTSDIREALENFTTVEEFERCAPFFLPDRERIYFQGAAGRQWTLKENRRAFERLQIMPRVLRDVSKPDLSVMVLNQRISMPIAAAPVAYQKLASDLGEIDTVRAMSAVGSLMTLSSISTTTIEEVAEADTNAVLWMQVYIFPNRSLTVDIIRRAEASGYKAIVVTVDSPILGSVPITAREILEGNSRNLSAVNVEPIGTDLDSSVTFQDLAWLVRMTRLPVVAKGILSPEDAIQAVRTGVSAIWVSNHGGRQLDYTPATIDVLPKIVNVLRRQHSLVEVYMDGGVRNGFDVFKALALGARLVFVGRPVIWGLVTGGQQGVERVFNILRNELKETMLLAGTPNVHSISKRMLVHERKCESPGGELYSLFPERGYENFLE